MNIISLTGWKLIQARAIEACFCYIQKKRKCFFGKINHQLGGSQSIYSPVDHTFPAERGLHITGLLT